MAGFVLGIKGTKLNCKNFVLEAVCGKGLGGRGQRYILEIIFFFLAWSYLLCYIHLYTRKRKILLTNFNFCSIDSAIQTLILLSRQVSLSSLTSSSNGKRQLRERSSRFRRKDLRSQYWTLMWSMHVVSYKYSSSMNPLIPL